MGLSTEIDVEDVAGGIFARELRRAAPNEPEVASRIWQQVRGGKTWVVTKFGSDDLVNLLRLEALAYEYWLATARMRLVGKGGKILVRPGGRVLPMADETLGVLIGNYDRRIEHHQFSMSAIGVASYTEPAQGQLVALLASYNLYRNPWSKIGLLDDVNVQPEFVPNFQYALMSLSAYAEAHAFAENAFRKARGFSFASLCGYLVAIVNDRFAVEIHRESPGPRGVGVLELYQRAYSMVRKDGYAQTLQEVAVEFMDSWVGAGKHDMLRDAPLVHEFLTCPKGGPPGSGLWSLGPRYVFFEHGPGVLVDLQGLMIILSNAFFAIPFDQGVKGGLFEEEFRRYASKAGLNLLPERLLRAGTLERELDAGFRVGSSLFLCECRAMERPLDFEIGKLRTIEVRTEDLKAKVKQVTSLAEFIRDQPKGDNYDFSWASSIEPLVVSPFIEWVWSRENHLWVDDVTPRILSAAEAVNLMQARQAQSQVSEPAS